MGIKERIIIGVVKGIVVQVVLKTVIFGVNKLTKNKTNENSKEEFIGELNGKQYFVREA